MTLFLRARSVCIILATMPLLALAQPQPTIPSHAPGVSVTQKIRGGAVTISLLAGGNTPLLVVRLVSPPQPASGLSNDEIVTAIGNMLDSLAAQHGLPMRLMIQLGSLEPLFIQQLQARLSQPNANWNPRTGNARRGSAYSTLPGEALASIEGTALGRAFTQRGYRLSAGEAAEHVKIGLVPGRGSARLPVWIGYLPVLAMRE